MSEPAKPKKPRAPRHVWAASRLLQKEARRIIRRHVARIAPEAIDEIRASVAAIDTLGRSDVRATEREAEHLDDLLHHHATFARKSAWRETVDNVGVAVLVALALRSCVYEPYKIPSGSMMPTLRSGDYIFVNKFGYGIQIPFTTTVVAEDLVSPISRGDVVVFRYPLDPNDDYIKRVIGLAGDTIRVHGESVEIKRKGDTEFETLVHYPTKEACLDDDGIAEVDRCRIYEEEFEGRRYRVRYLRGGDVGESEARTVTVPEGHLFVLGDNRRMSHDSLQWMATVEALAADGLLGVKDLRDLTTERMFTLRHPDGDDEDESRDHVLYMADHPAPEVGLSLQVWRAPTLGAKVIFDTLVARDGVARPTTMTALAEGLTGPERDRALQVGEGLSAIAVGEEGPLQRVTFLLHTASAVFVLECGKVACPRGEGALGARVADVVGRFQRDHQQDASELLEGDPAIRYTQQWRDRDGIDERFFERVLARPDGEGARDRVRVRVWRRPDEGIEFIRDAALASVGSSRGLATPMPTLGSDDWLVESSSGFTWVSADLEHSIAVLLECGRARCRNADAATELAAGMRAKLGPAAAEERRLPEILGHADVPWPELPVLAPDRYEWDRVQLDGTIRGGEHQVSVEVVRRPEMGLEAQVQSWASEIPDAVPDAAISAGGYASEQRGQSMVFALEAAELAVRIQCGSGLCPSRDLAVAIAQRIAEKSRDPDNFLDPAAKRARPFVPRGNVKGRADRIWLPFSRFWLEIE